MVDAAHIMLYAVIGEIVVLTLLSSDKRLKEKLEARGVAISPFVIMVDVGKVPRLRRVTSSRITRAFFLIAGLINFAALLILLYWQVLPSLYGVIHSAVSGAGKVSSPFVPVIPGLTISLDVFPYILIALSIGVALHEFFHALAAYAVGWRVDAWGVGLFLIFPLAYVKPSEEDYRASSLKAKATVLSAGVLANTVLFLLSMPFLPLAAAHIATAPTIVGLMNTSQELPALKAGIKPPLVILSVNDTHVSSVYQFIDLLIPYRNKTVLIYLRASEATLKNGEVLFDPNSSHIYVIRKPAGSMIGVYLQDIPVYGTSQLAIEVSKFLYWMGIVNISLGIINAAPLYISDGGRLISEVLKGRRVLNHIVQGGSVIAIVMLLAVGLMKFI